MNEVYAQRLHEQASARATVAAGRAAQGSPVRGGVHRRASD